MSEELERRIDRLETRVSVMETRADAIDRRLGDVQVSLGKLHDALDEIRRDVRSGLDRVFSLLRDHIDSESKDRQKFLGAALLAALGGIASFGGWLVMSMAKHAWPEVPIP